MWGKNKVGNEYLLEETLFAEVEPGGEMIPDRGKNMHRGSEARERMACGTGRNMGT